MATQRTFLKEYIKAIRDGNAAVFAGAGLSRPSGFVDWKELLRPLAEEIGLNIDDEHDLTLVAQYVRNKAGNRGVINKSIMEAFNRDVDLNDNVRVLTRLPIETYWTTNYDRLIEDGLREANRNADVKMESEQLPNTKRDRDAVVYKMHGDMEHPAKAVLTKDDYVKYDTSYPLFREVLKGDLVSKTFLFIGFSFEDPNLDYSWQHPEDSFTNNCNIFLNLIDAIRKSSPNCRILSVGSSEEYGNVAHADLPIRENQPLNPLSPYAVARVSQEQLSRVYVDAFGMQIIMTRSFNHIGPRQDERFVIPSFVKQILGIKHSGLSKGEIETGDVSIIRDFVDVRDVVDAYYKLLIRIFKIVDVFDD